MKTYFDKISISVPHEDRLFIKETAEKKNCSVSKFIQDVIAEYREFDAYRNKKGNVRMY